MKILSDTTREPIPAGKRTARENVWGNTNGYVSGKLWVTIGPTNDPATKQRVKNWLAGREPDDDGDGV